MKARGAYCALFLTFCLFYVTGSMCDGGRRNPSSTERRVMSTTTTTLTPTTTTTEETEVEPIDYINITTSSTPTPQPSSSDSRASRLENVKTEIERALSGIQNIKYSVILQNEEDQSSRLPALTTATGKNPVISDSITVNVNVKQFCEDNGSVHHTKTPIWNNTSGDEYRRNMTIHGNSQPAHFNNNFCKLPMEPGPCRALINSWYFDTVSQACDSFVYGGCQGNQNRFDSLEACETHCPSSQVTVKVDSLHEMNDNVTTTMKSTVDADNQKTLDCPSQCQNLNCSFGAMPYNEIVTDVDTTTSVNSHDEENINDCQYACKCVDPCAEKMCHGAAKCHVTLQNDTYQAVCKGEPCGGVIEATTTSEIDLIYQNVYDDSDQQETCIWVILAKPGADINVTLTSEGFKAGKNSSAVLSLHYWGWKQTEPTSWRLLPEDKGMENILHSSVAIVTFTSRARQSFYTKISAAGTYYPRKINVNFLGNGSSSTYSYTQNTTNMSFTILNSFPKKTIQLSLDANDVYDSRLQAFLLSKAQSEFIRHHNFGQGSNIHMQAPENQPVVLRFLSSPANVQRKIWYSYSSVPTVETTTTKQIRKDTRRKSTHQR